MNGKYLYIFIDFPFVAYVCFTKNMYVSCSLETGQWGCSLFINQGNHQHHPRETFAKIIKSQEEASPHFQNDKKRTSLVSILGTSFREQGAILRFYVRITFGLFLDNPCYSCRNNRYITRQCIFANSICS